MDKCTRYLWLGIQHKERCEVPSWLVSVASDLKTSVSEVLIARYLQEILQIGHPTPNYKTTVLIPDGQLRSTTYLTIHGSMLGLSFFFFNHSFRRCVYMVCECIWYVCIYVHMCMRHMCVHLTSDSLPQLLSTLYIEAKSLT